VIEVGQVCPVGCRCLHHHMIGLAKLVEIVDVQGAHLRLQGNENFIQRDAQVLRLQTIYVNEVLRNIRPVRAEHTLQVGVLVAFHHQCIDR